MFRFMRAQHLVHTLTFSLASTFAVTSAPASPAAGVQAPVELPSLRGNAWSVSENPSGVGFLDGFHGALNLSLSEERRVSDGVSGRLAWGTEVGSSGMRIGLGLGADNYFDFDSTGANAWQTTLVAALGSEQLSAGLRYRLYTGTEIGARNRFHSGDFSMTARPLRELAVRIGVNDVFSPNYLGDALPREWVVGLGAQTTNRRFGVDIGWAIRHRAPRETRTWQAAIRGRVWQGISLFASTSFRPHAGSDSFEFSGGLAVASRHGVASGAVHGYPDETPAVGFSVALESLQRGEPFVGRGDRQLLRVRLHGAPSETPRSSFLGLVGHDAPAFTDVVHRLYQLADTDAAGVFLHLADFKPGPAQLNELLQALEAIRDQGKEVVVYIARGGLRDLAVAGAATWAAVPRNFYVTDTGVSARSWYLREFFEHLDMDPQFVRTGRYKTGPERFTASERSEESLEQLRPYISAWYDQLVAAIGSGASPETDIKSVLASAPLTPAVLRDAGVIDAVGFEDELPRMLHDALGEQFQAVESLNAFANNGAPWLGRDGIAILHIDGAIVAGESGRNPLTGEPFTGHESVARAVADIVSSPRIHGAIVRIDSPGGSALASDEILNELSRLSRRLPTVVSIGDVAASGGYYSALTSDLIVASPTSLTGSIGVYAGTIGLDSFLAALGVNRSSVELGGPDDFFNGRSWSGEDIAVMQRMVDHVLDLFVDLVAEARNMPEAQARTVADGRTFTGAAAQDVGLVDSLGGFRQAVQELCARMPTCDDVNSYALRHYSGRGGAGVPSIALARAGEAVGSEVFGRLARSLGSHGLGPVYGLALSVLSTESSQAMLASPWIFELTER